MSMHDFLESRIRQLKEENERLRFWLKDGDARRRASNAYPDFLAHVADNNGYQSIDSEWPHFRFPPPGDCHWEES